MALKKPSQRIIELVCCLIQIVEEKPLESHNWKYCLEFLGQSNLLGNLNEIHEKAAT